MILGRDQVIAPDRDGDLSRVRSCQETSTKIVLRESDLEASCKRCRIIEAMDELCDFMMCSVQIVYKILRDWKDVGVPWSFHAGIVMQFT